MDKTISYYIKDFSKTKNPVSLFKAGVLIVKGGRLGEVLYGVYSFLSYKPSKLYRDLEKEAFFDQYIEDHFKKKYHGFEGLIYKDYLKERFGKRFNIDLIPDDVRFRLPSILDGGEWLALGEYGEASGRIYFFKGDQLQVIDYYNKIKGFRHIHCIHPDKENYIFIATGDDRKFLDRWKINENQLVFDKRLIKRFAGYTAAVKINGIDYFGTDFSQRPNYILRWPDKKKFFFPENTFTMYVEYFEVIDNRYILSLNMHIKDFGGKAAIVFDTKTKKFIYVKELTQDNGEWKLINYT